MNPAGPSPRQDPTSASIHPPAGPSSLRWRLIAAVSTATTLVMALAATAIWWSVARSRTLAFDQAIRDHARLLRPRLEEIAWRHNRDPLLPIEDLVETAGPEGRALLLRGPDGRLYARSHPNLERLTLPRHPGPDGVLEDAELPGLGSVRWMVLDLAGRPPPGRRPEERMVDENRPELRPPRREPPGRNPDQPRDPPGERPAPTAQPQTPPGGNPRQDGTSPRPLAQLVLIGPVGPLRSQLRLQAVLLAGLATTIDLIVVALIALIVQHLLRPVRRLGQAISATTPGSGGQVTVPGLPQELLPVQTCLNGLLDRVDQVLARERQTTANIAHELRTPLTGLRTRLELALLHPDQTGILGQTCQQGLQILSLLQGLVDNLLLLARLEAGQVELHREAVEIAEIVATTWLLHQPAAEGRGLRLDCAIEPALALTTDAGKLRAVVGNLLSNAVAHAQAGTVIRLEAAESGEQMRLVLVNQGSAVSAAEAERVFEPFWRADAARTVEQGHAGLGLPLVQRLVAILGGSVRVEVEEGLFRVEVLLPLE